MAARRSVVLPITLGVMSVGLTIALLVGWTLLLVKIRDLTGDGIGSITLLVVGIISYAIIMSAVVLLVLYVIRQLQEVRRQDSFIDSVTHELKTPLASIRLGLETLERKELNDDQREQFRSMMLKDVDRLSAFIDDVLEASRLVHGQRSLSVGDVVLKDAVVHCAQTTADRYGLDPALIQVEVPTALSVRTDASALDVILRNLIDNAIKYSDGTPNVRVAAVRNAGRVSLSVEDHGIGIPAGFKRRVGQRFFRVPTEAVRTRRGTGLGLFVVTALVRSLGGHVSITSPGPGLGTRVDLTLPPTPE